jgi:Tripartite tricarboxylate transporter TctB family
MAIKSQKDFFSGLLFTAVGVAFAWGATNYSVGTGARMGPGYFPLILGICMAILGAVITFKALVVETAGGEKVGAFAWKPLFFIIAANLVFGLSIGGLPSIKLPAMGLIFGIFAVVAVASMAGDKLNLIDIWFGAVLGVVLAIFTLEVLSGILISLLSYLNTIVQALGVKLPLILKGLTYFAQAGGRILAFLIVAFIFYKFAPIRRGTKEYALLAMTLICMAVWSFVTLLGIQFPVWPTFLTA